jgi:hypothetical protein
MLKYLEHVKDFRMNCKLGFCFLLTTSGFLFGFFSFGFLVTARMVEELIRRLSPSWMIGVGDGPNNIRCLDI